MKKFVAVLLIAALGAVVAHADYYVNMSINFGIYNETGTLGALPVVGDTGLLQLFYVGANGTADYFNVSGSAGTLGDITGLTADGDDVLLGSFTFVNNGAAFADYGFPASATLSTNFLGATVYGRLIATGQDGVTDGDWYYQGAYFSATDKTLPGDPPATPDVYSLDGGADGQWTQMGQVYVIPEPATLGMIGVATIGLFITRKKYVKR
ncbi:MAG: PEP-CTERM sorting domain-containing protein [Kiritimatiellales bacterium]|nr:PEP-CTERM sorting domain-containing protein [Kiritimatiellales bacterium]